MLDQDEQVKKKPSREMACNPVGSPDAPGLLVRLVGLEFQAAEHGLSL